MSGDVTYSSVDIRNYNIITDSILETIFLLDILPVLF